jgi:cytochrome c biogenesis protein CcdA/thiol-disulfide isomerase/thioredoxin
MFILIIFAFLGGIVTILSPCILAVLPVILSGATGGKSKPLGIVSGFVLSFTFFTLFLTSLVNIVGISPNVLRILAIIVLIVFGISMLVPNLRAWTEKMFSKVASLAPASNKGSGFASGLIVGLSLGLLWTPCVGPILASVISLALTGTISGGALLITLAYALGTALPMLAIMAGGRNLILKVTWLKKNSDKIQQAFGVLMIIVALLIVFNLDKRLQVAVTEKLPDYSKTLTSLERNDSVINALDTLTKKDNDMKDKEGDYKMAPEIIPGGEWFNSEPLSLEELKGKVVMLDFITYSCINCIRTIPYLNAWYEEYSDEGLVIIGIHTPEFEFEKNPDNVAKALKDLGIEFPVVQDNNYETWRAYDNHYWPRKYLIDHERRVVYDHIGEGGYEETEEKIQELLKASKEAMGMELEEMDDSTRAESINAETIDARSPETYFGSSRNKLLANGKQRISGEFDFDLPKIMVMNKLYLSGKWNINDEYARPMEKGAKIVYRYNAQKVFLVAGSDSASKLRVYQDGELISESKGSDVNENGEINIEEQKLYRIIENDKRGVHLLELEAEDDNLQVFTFTFG